MSSDIMSSDGNFDLRNDRLSEISDEELVHLSIDSRLSASYMSELIYRYFGFIKGKAAAMCITPSSYDDFVQEGLLGFLSAVRNFDSSKGAKFSSFAYVCVINKMKTAAAKLSRVSSSEEGSEDEHGEDNITPESIIMQRELVRELTEGLSPMEYDIFTLFIAGLSCEEIAERMGITRKAADNAVQRARSKLRRIIP